MVGENLLRIIIDGVFRGKDAIRGVNDLKARVVSLETEIKKLVSDNKLLSDSLNKVSNSSKKTAADLAEANGKAHSLGSSNKKLNTVYTDQVSRLSVLGTAIKKYQGMQERGIQLDDKSKSKLEKLKTEYAALGGSVDKLGNKIKNQSTKWNTTNTIIGEHNKHIKRTQTRFKEVGGTLKKFSRTQEKVGTKWKTMQPSMQSVDNKLKKLLGSFTMFRWALVNVTMAIGVLVSIKKFAEWGANVEGIMYKVSAVTKETVESIESSVQNLRRGTIFSVEEMGDALLEVSKRGFEIKDSMQIMEASATLAIGGFTDLKTASEVLTNALKVFNLGAEDSMDVANALTYVALNTATSVDKLAQAMEYVGPMANLAGIKVEELAAVFGMLQNKIPKATKAATSLRGIIAKLINPAREAEQTLRELGYSFFDMDGNLKGLTRSLETLQQILSDMGTEEEKLKFIMELFSIRPSAGAAALVDMIENEENALYALTNAADVSKAAEESRAKQEESSINRIKTAKEDLKSTFVDFAETVGEGEAVFMSWLGASSQYTDALKIFQTELEAGVISLEEYFNVVGQVAPAKGVKLVELLDTLGITMQEYQDIIGKADKLPAHLSAEYFKRETDEIIDFTNKKIESQKSADDESKRGILTELEWAETLKKSTDATELFDVVTKKEINTVGQLRYWLGGLLKKNIQYGGQLLSNIQIKQMDEDITNGNIGAYEKWNGVIDVNLGKLTALEKASISYTTILSDMESDILKLDKTTQTAREQFDDWNVTILDAINDIVLFGEKTKEEINLLWDNYDVLKALKSEQLEVNEAKERATAITNAQTIASKAFSIMNKQITEELKGLTNVYKDYKNMLFVGEKEQLDALHEIELGIKRETLAQLELGDATDSATNAVISQKDEYNSWKTTVEEVIRALISEGNATAENVSEIVRAQQTALLGTSKFGGTSEETELEKLQRQRQIMQLEYELGMGEQHYLLEEHISGLEATTDAEWSNLATAISSIDTQKNKIDELTSKQQEISDAWNDAQNAVWAASGVWDLATVFMNGNTQLQIDMIYNLITSYKDLAAQAVITANEQAKVTGGSSGGGQSVWTPEAVDAWSGIWQDTWNTTAQSISNNNSGYTDYDNQQNVYTGFASGGLVTSPTRALIGESGPELIVPLTGTHAGSPSGVGSLGTNVSIGNITISGASGNPSDFARQFARELKRELNTM